MRLSVFLCVMVCACVVAIVVAAPAPQDQDDVRGAFMTSRPKDRPASSETTSKPSRRRPRSAVTSSSDKTADKSSKKSGNPTAPSTSNKPSDTRKPVNTSRLGLGMTLFTRDSNGLAVRVDPEHVFHQGDRVRVLLETNSDGYLYIFNKTDEGPVMMIYPNPDLDEAGNYIKAHVPWEIPSSTADQERLRWLVFDQNPGNEHLFFVFTREPLNGVPIEDELISFCRNANGKCPWRPSTEIWEQIQKQMEQPLKIAKSERFGRAQTEPEQQASTRGLALAKEDPEPSLIMMASSTSPMLVATLDLIHK